MLASTVSAATTGGIVELTAAVTGVQDGVSDSLTPACFGQTLNLLRPKGHANHQWDATPDLARPVR